MSPSQALNILLTVPLVKVTVAKEVVRLLGEVKLEGAYQRLLAISSQADLHRDIRVAILRGLWDYLERDETWPVLEKAALDPDPALATVVGRIPATRLSPLAQRRLARLLTSLLAHPEARVRADVLARCSQLPITDSDQLLLPSLLKALDSLLPGEYSLAAAAITTTYNGKDAHLVGEAVSRILPRRRVLQTQIAHLNSQARDRRSQLLPTAQAALAAMAPDPLTAALRVELAIAYLDWEDLAGFLLEMAQRGELYEDVVSRATQALFGLTARPDVTNLATLETRLAVSPDPKLRRLALASLVVQAQPPQGWDVAKLARLQEYQADQAPLVAAAAQFTFPYWEV